jgi:glucosyl-3-phosphoglycerate phosphatase
MSSRRPPGGVLRVSFVRHGQSDANVRGEWQGHGDAPLSPLGREQAAALGARLRTVPFDWVESSDLIRARTTSEVLGANVTPNPAFREIDLGAWEGLTREEVAKRFPAEVAQLAAGAPIRIGGGESWEDLHVRASLALDDLRARLAPGQHAVVFSHGGVVTTLFSGLLGVRERRPFPIGHVLNTSWSTARFEDGRVIVERYNDGSHHPTCCSWADARYEGEDSVLTYVAWPSDAPPPPELPTDAAEHWLSGVTRVFAADAGLEEARETLARSLGAIAVNGLVPVDAPRELGAAHPGGRILVVATPETIVRAAGAVLGGESAMRLAPPPVGSLSHVVVSRHGCYLRDFGVGPMPSP